MTYSDSHCHLDGYQPELLAQVLEQARAQQVDIIVGMGMDLESSEETLRLARSYQAVLAAVGIHPWNAVSPTEDIRAQLRALADREDVVALGEVGLDYARSPETREVQKGLLTYELSLARELGLPVNIHCREAHQDMMEILRGEAGSGVKGVIHGFSGDRAALRDWLELGFYVSIGVRGFVTDETSPLHDVVTDIPLARLLTETDSSGRGEIGGPTAVLLVVDKLASVMGVDAKELGDTATENLRHLLKH